MKNIIIGTAGHIDHGKTALIKALTGKETDRWEEEKRTGRNCLQRPRTSANHADRRQKETV